MISIPKFKVGDVVHRNDIKQGYTNQKYRIIKVTKTRYRLVVFPSNGRNKSKIHRAGVEFLDIHYCHSLKSMLNSL